MYFEAVEKIDLGDVDAALQILESLIEQYPDFSLAQLTYADVLSSRASVLNGAGGDFHNLERVNELLLEANLRKLHQDAKAVNDDITWPANILKLSNSQKHVVIVDVSESRVFLYQNIDGTLVAIDDYYVSIGKGGVVKTREGDERTPIGVYFLTTKITSEHLGDLYGSGALPINYPNEWDQKQGRTGYGIWLHGVPSNTYSRAPYASQGCMALSNEHMTMLLDTLEVGNTPVIIADKLETISISKRDQMHNEVMSHINRWNNDRLRGNTEKFLDHYTDQARHPRSILDLFMNTEVGSTGEIDMRSGVINDISMFHYPMEEEMIVVTFNQEAGSTENSSSSSIRQYWQLQEDGAWRIVQENLALFSPIHFRGIPSSAMNQSDS